MDASGSNYVFLFFSISSINRRPVTQPALQTAQNVTIRLIEVHGIYGQRARDVSAVGASGHNYVFVFSLIQNKNGLS